MNDLQNAAKSLGIKLENAIGTPEHKAKWLGKLKIFGLSERSAEWVFKEALASRGSFSSFSDAIKAYAGVAQGIDAAPEPFQDAVLRGIRRAAEIDIEETKEAVNAVGEALTDLEAIVTSNGIGKRKVAGKKTNSVLEEIHTIRCSLARIRGAARD